VPCEIAMQCIKGAGRHLAILSEQRSLWERHTSDCVRLGSLPTPCHRVRMTEFGCDKWLCGSMLLIAIPGRRSLQTDTLMIRVKAKGTLRGHWRIRA
jgi:hypothetical protein